MNRGNKQGDGSVIEEAKMEEETTQTVAPNVELKRVNTDGLGGPNLRKAFGVDSGTATRGLSSIGGNTTAKKSTFSNDKAKIADVFELPITVVNNVLYQ